MIGRDFPGCAKGAWTTRKCERPQSAGPAGPDLAPTAAANPFDRETPHINGKGIII